MTDLAFPGRPAPTLADGDPTAVMGRRIVAWVLDLVLFLAVIVAVFASLAAPVDVPEGFLFDACEQLQAQDADAASGCIELGDTVYVTSSSDNGIQTLVAFGYLALFVLLQGLTGASPGKLLTGLRVVDEQGKIAGVGRSLVRTLLWVVDGAPWLVPVVGFVTGLTSTGHRRIGDLAAKTYVVSTGAVGAPPAPSAGALGAAPASWAPPPPTSSAGPWPPPAGSAPAPGAPPTVPRQPTASPEPVTTEFDAPDTPEDEGLTGEPDPFGAPAAPDTAPWADDLATDSSNGPVSAPPPDPTVPADERPPDLAGDPSWWSGPEADPTAGAWAPPDTPNEDFGTVAEDASPTAGPTPFVAPGSEAPPPTSQPAELPPPQWDQARGTYIQWDPRQQQWLQWDTVHNRWKLIDG